MKLCRILSFKRCLLTARNGRVITGHMFLIQKRNWKSMGNPFFPGTTSTFSCILSHDSSDFFSITPPSNQPI
eukprot:UN24329